MNRMDRLKSEVFVRISGFTSADVAENKQAYSRLPRPISPTMESNGATAALIKMSSVSQFVSELRHSVNTEGMYGAVRPEVVEKIRQELSTGKFGSDEDFRQAVDSLLRSL